MKLLILVTMSLMTGCVGMAPDACGWLDKHTFHNPETLSRAEKKREHAYNLKVEEFCRQGSLRAPIEWQDRSVGDSDLYRHGYRSGTRSGVSSSNS